MFSRLLRPIDITYHHYNPLLDTTLPHLTPQTLSVALLVKNFYIAYYGPGSPNGTITISHSVHSRKKEKRHKVQMALETQTTTHLLIFKHPQEN